MKRALDGAAGLARGALRGVADAARQLSLPLFGDAGPLVPPPAAPPGQRRHARIGAQVIEYELRRSRRRSIGFLIDGSGLRITAPRHTTLAEVDAALAEKAGWVLRKLDEWHEYVERREKSAIHWSFGERIPYLGTHLTLVRASESGAAASRRRACVVSDAHGLLAIWVPDPQADAVREVAQDWFKARARELFAERMPAFTERLGREPSRWGLSSARTRWGSCAPDGSIRLNWRLVHFPVKIVDYVIAHELAHLVHLNHSPRFWAKVEALMPDYREARRMLRDYPDDMLAH
jgi:predicted metal-dependent hydrolase